jgi:hypothetical protein
MPGREAANYKAIQRFLKQVDVPALRCMEAETERTNRPVPVDGFVLSQNRSSVMRWESDGNCHHSGV